MKRNKKSKKSPKKNIIIEVILTILILFPNILALILAKDIPHIGPHIAYFIYSIILFLIPTFWFKAKAFFYFEGLILALGFIEVVHLLLNKATTSLLFIHTLFLTEPREAIEMSGAFWPAIVVMALYIVAYYLIVSFFVINRAFYPTWMRWVGGIALPCFVILSLQTQRNVKKSYYENDVMHQENNEVYHMSTLEKCFPLNIFRNTYKALHQRRVISAYQENQKDFSFNIPNSDVKAPVTIVFVIGETARYGNFGINGYERNTTPLLSKEQNLISFDSIYSIANLTAVSVPLILSRATPENVGILTKEKSISSAFNEGGYYTAWLANQSYGNPIMMAANHDCDYIHYIPLDPNGVTNRDEELNKLLQPVLDEHHDRHKFIIMHSMGCHFNYTLRYPERFKRYEPEIKKDFTLKEIFQYIRSETTDSDGTNSETNDMIQNLKTLLVNSYDNGILYTDYFLDRTIEQLKCSGTPAILVYVGDHGENLLDDSKNMMLHGSYDGSLYEYHVPLMIWYSDSYKAQHPKLIEQLYANEKVKSSTMTIFHTLLELGFLKYDQFEPSLSLANKALVRQDTILGLDANLKVKPLQIP